MKLDNQNGLPPLPEDLPTETVALLCNFLLDLAEAIQARYCVPLLAHLQREYEREAIADARADELYPDHVEEDEPPF